MNPFITGQKLLNHEDELPDIVTLEKYLIGCDRDVSFTYKPFKTYKWKNDLFLTEKIQFFSASLTIFSWNKAFYNNYILNKLFYKKKWIWKYPLV